MKTFATIVVLLAVVAAGCASIFGQQCTGDPTTWSCTCNGSQGSTCYPPLQDGKKPDGGAATDGGGQ